MAESWSLLRFWGNYTGGDIDQLSFYQHCYVSRIVLLWKTNVLLKVHKGFENSLSQVKGERRRAKGWRFNPLIPLIPPLHPPLSLKSLYLCLKLLTKWLSNLVVLKSLLKLFPVQLAASASWCEGESLQCSKILFGVDLLCSTSRASAFMYDHTFFANRRWLSGYLFMYSQVGDMKAPSESLFSFEIRVVIRHEGNFSMSMPSFHRTRCLTMRASSRLCSSFWICICTFSLWSTFSSMDCRHS